MNRIVLARGVETMMIVVIRVMKRDRLVQLYFAKTTYLSRVIILVNYVKIGKEMLLA